MQLGTRFALALLLTTIQFSATSAEDAPKAPDVGPQKAGLDCGLELVGEHGKINFSR